MNEERFIETLLRRYAKKRRADAGAPLEMHPATRRLLRAEVARRFGNAAREEAPVANAWVRFWRGWGRQLAWATPVLVAAGVIVWALQQETAQPDSKSLELRQARSAAPATPMNIEAQPPVPANRALAVTEPAFAPPQPARRERGTRRGAEHQNRSRDDESGAGSAGGTRAWNVHGDPPGEVAIFYPRIEAASA